MKSAIAFLVAFAVASPAFADAPTKDVGSVECAAANDVCEAGCETKFKPDTLDRAKCVAHCSVEYLACDVQAGYETARPWVADKVEQAKKMLDEMMRRMESKPEPKSTPRDKSI